MIVEFSESNWVADDQDRAALDHVVHLGGGLVAISGWCDLVNAGAPNIRAQHNGTDYLIEEIFESPRADVRKMYEAEGRDPKYLFGFFGVVRISDFSEGKASYVQVSAEGAEKTLEGLSAFAQPSSRIDLIRNPLRQLFSQKPRSVTGAGNMDLGVVLDYLDEMVSSGWLSLVDIALLSQSEYSKDSAVVISRILNARLISLLEIDSNYIGDRDFEEARNALLLAQEFGAASEETLGRFSQLALHIGRDEVACATGIDVLFKAKNPDLFLLSFFGAAVRPTFWLPYPEDSLEPEKRVLMRNRLQECAMALRAANNHGLATLFFTAAALSLENQTTKLNAGLACLEQGWVEAARKCFSGVNRVSDRQFQPIVWPRKNGKHWPHYRYLHDTADRQAEQTSEEAWPRISVVFPSYNQVEFVEETLLSAINQNYPNLQLIFVDGQSDDGTLDVVERYRSQLDIVLVEADEGQTHAINKGFALADGDLITWLNTDDMFGPGALHLVAQAFKDTGADLFAGICLEHSNNIVKHANRASLKQNELTVGVLSEVFQEWFSGKFFYQPEVFFTREIFERAGGTLDPSLHYAMDYDMWMRFAGANVRLELLPWPMAYFRIHENQKTSRLRECIEEQCTVRARYVDVQPTYQRRVDIAEKLRHLRAQSRPVVAVISSRAGKVFSDEAIADAIDAISPKAEVIFADAVTEEIRNRAHAVIMLIHVFKEEDFIADLRDSPANPLILGWFWDNHHHFKANFNTARMLDIVVPGHGEFVEYLRNTHALQWPSVPLCTTQWSRWQGQQVHEAFGNLERDERLYGGFVDYAYADERNDFVLACQAKLGASSALTLLPENQMHRYFDRTPEDRLKDWTGYKVSLKVPLYRDLSQRFFDALLAGQIPLVPIEMGDFDDVIPKSLQEELPVIRFSIKDVESVAAAYDTAVDAFDRDGADGIRRRHQFAVEHHLFAHRLKHFCDLLFDDASWEIAPPKPLMSADALEGRKPLPSAQSSVAKEPQAPMIAPTRSRFFVDGQHGLGNRLRAIGSAAAIAEATDRELVIVWTQDAHCEASFRDLFDYDGAVIDEPMIDSAEAASAQIYNYMEVEPGGVKDKAFDLSWDGDIYGRSAYVFKAEPSTWAAENAFLKKLVPNSAVTALVESVRNPNDVSAHIRMVGGAEFEDLEYESAKNWTAKGHEETGYWRKKSHFSVFIDRLQRLIDEGDVKDVFVAADRPETYEVFKQTFGDGVVYLDRAVYDRSAEQLQYALADAILLSRSPLLLGSSWSSFSELAMRLAPGKIEIELSGKDF